MAVSKIRGFTQILSQSITPTELSASVVGTGLTGGAGSAIAVSYGSTANTSAQGSVRIELVSGGSRKITISSGSVISVGSGGAITVDIPNDFSTVSGSFQFLSGSQVVMGSGSFNNLSGSYIAAPTASFGVLNATVFSPTTISTTSGSITELSVTHIKRSDLFNQFLFNQVLVYSSSAASLSRWWLNTTPIYAGSENLYMNGLLQDSGSSDDYVAELATISGSVRTLINFNYDVPGDSKVLCSYIPIS